MTDKKPIVVVAGATGRAGRLIVDELLRKNFHVRALIVKPFDPPEPPGLTAPNIELVEGDFGSSTTLEKALAGADYLISAIGSTKIFNKKEFEKIDVIANRDLAQAAKAAGVEQIVVISSLGAGNSKDAMGCIYRLMMGHVIKAKTKLEETIKAVGINYTIIRPGGYSNKELSGEIAIGEGGKIGGLVRREQIAKVCVEAVSKPVMKNRTFEVIDASKVKPECRQFIIKI